MRAVEEARRKFNEASSHEAPPPWKDAKLPDRFGIDEKGVYQDEGNSKKDHICGPCWAIANTRDHNSEGWGLVLEWLDRDGKLHQRAIPLSRLHEKSNNSLARELSDAGLWVIPGKESALAQYLAQYNTTARWTPVSQAGWVEGDLLRFVLPGKIMSPAILSNLSKSKSSTWTAENPEGTDMSNLSNLSNLKSQDDLLDKICPGMQKEVIVFQPDRHSPTLKTMRGFGTLGEWKENIVARIADEPYMLFALGVGLSGPFIRFSGVEAGGFHFVQLTSRGKTTAAQVAASVWGCAADPSTAPTRTFVNKWNGTTNALEALAAAHCDTLLVLDELGNFSDKQDFSSLIYMITGGAGKSRLTQDATLRHTLAFRPWVISTGEISIREKVQQGGGIMKGGIAVRFPDIPVDDSLILNAENPGALAKDLKAACAVYFGVAGPALIQSIIDTFLIHESATDVIKSSVANAKARLLESRTLPPEAERTLERFALVEVALEYARQHLELPVSQEQVHAAMTFVTGKWMTQAKTDTDGQRYLDRIRDFCLASPPDAFMDINADQSANKFKLNGYKGTVNGEDIYFFTGEQLKVAAGGSDAASIARALKIEDALLLNQDSLQYKVNLRREGKRRNMYAIRTSKFDSDRSDSLDNPDQA